MEKNRAGEERVSMVQGWRHSLCMGKSELQHQISQGKSWIDTGACSFWDGGSQGPGAETVMSSAMWIRDKCCWHGRSRG